MTQCGRIGCDREATHYPCLVVPAIGFPATPENCLQAVIGLVTCREHAGEQELATNMPEESQARIRMALVSIGKVAPDFKRARIEPRRIGDKQWREFQTMNARAEGGGTA